jgi:LacI family transcriptional regulator, repressor for deo operon, udp, cdd, tsx, nupC, and nupG
MLAAMKPRLRDVAEQAGVSQATVSRVLNDRPGVSEVTRREVHRVMDLLGYEPTGLRRRSRRPMIGLIIPELDNPAFPRFAQAIETRLVGLGLSTVLCTSTPAGLSQAEYLNVLLEHDVAGVIVVSGDTADVTADHGHYLEVVSRGIPVVVVNGRAPGLSLPAVTVDHVTAARQAVAHLVSLGHRKIGLATGPSRYVPSQEFTTGYELGLQDAGLLEHSLFSETIYSLEGGHAAGLELLEFGVTGVVAASDMLALGIVRAARELGLSVPQDVSIVGFDDAGPNAYVDPPLTSSRQPFGKMAGAIVRMLRDRLEGPQVPATEFRFHAELVVRSSTGPAPHRTANAAADGEATVTPDDDGRVMPVEA